MSLKSVTVTTRSERRENQSFRPSFSGSTHFCTYKDAKICVTLWVAWKQGWQNCLHGAWLHVRQSLRTD